MRTYTRIGLIVLIGLFTCMPAVSFAASTLDEASLSVTSSKPTLTGTSDATSVRITIEDENGKKKFSSRDIKVRNGEWKAKVSKTLKVGTYEVTLFEKNKKGKRVEADSAPLTVLGKGSADASLTVSMVPLLMGGTARSYASAPVAYIRVANSGKATTTLSGVTLTENGSAADTIVTGFATNDDKGGSRTNVAASFKNGSVFVPLTATVAPGQIRIFTIKALLGSTAGQVGTQLKIDVAGISANGSIKGMFPLRGTTFTLGL